MTDIDVRLDLRKEARKNYHLLLSTGRMSRDYSDIFNTGGHGSWFATEHAVNFDKTIHLPVTGNTHPWYERGCGYNKGCLSYPGRLCVGSAWCDMLATWKSTRYEGNDAIEVQLQLNAQSKMFMDSGKMMLKHNRELFPYISLVLAKDGAVYNVPNLAFMCVDPHAAIYVEGSNTMIEVLIFILYI